MKGGTAEGDMWCGGRISRDKACSRQGQHRERICSGGVTGVVGDRMTSCLALGALAGDEKWDGRVRKADTRRGVEAGLRADWDRSNPHAATEKAEPG